MSQVLQWTQFCALIWKRGWPLSSSTHFVDAGRAIALRRLGVERQIDARSESTGPAAQVNRLVLLVVGVRQEHRGQLVEDQHAVGLGILRSAGIRPPASASRGRPCSCAASTAGGGRESCTTCRSRRRACRATVPHFERRLHVAHLVEVLPDPRAPDSASDRRSSSSPPVLPAASASNAASARQHAGLDRVVAALDARHVDEARRAADQRAAREGELRHRLQAALVDRARAVAEALAALEVLGGLADAS